MVARRIWLLDLDNTLHDARHGIFPQINVSMTRYLMAALDCDHDHADRLRRLYLERYGATLRGMMRHHGTRPRHFLWHTHQFTDLARLLRPSFRLRATLARLPGRRVLFSNAPRFYSAEVLRQLGVSSLFHDLWCIEQMRFEPKPRRRGYLSALRRQRVAVRRCVLVDDLLENLRAAKRLGMTTVWVSNERRHARGVDLRVGNFAQLARRLHHLAPRSQ
jgi:putative hydrolase of the HAD superfamily